MDTTEKDDTSPTARLSRAAWRRIMLGMAVLAIFLATSLVLWRTGVLDALLMGDTLEQAVIRLGPLGPAMIIGLMTIAIVGSPIPSAPIARLLGYDALRAWLGVRATPGLLQRFITSQNALMAAVFATRLMPFLSFDVVSYAAGLSPLKPWRFAIATLLGVLPASFLLAHFGDELVSDDLRRAGLTVLVLGTLTLLPLAWKAAPPRYRAAVRRWLHLG